jgi:hypothetical protein
MLGGERLEEQIAQALGQHYLTELTLRLGGGLDRDTRLLERFCLRVHG